MAFSDFIRNILERVKNGERLWAIAPPLYKRGGFFMILLLVILLGIYLRELRTENVYEAIKLPLFRKEGAGGRFNYYNLFKINLPNPSLQKRAFL
ncbi:hypothetical protein AC245_02215 [Haemophilus parainfluenzae]|nr:hypothetical protein AC245_02215 [Haemophilus parainfluenzae]